MSYDVLEEAENLKILDLAEDDTDVIVDDYKDLAIETVASSHDRRLWWMKDYD